MYSYYVIEIQTNSDGTSGNFIWGYADMLEAEDKFLDVRKSANDSNVMIHTVMFITNRGVNVEKPVCYVHPVEQEPVQGD